MVKSRPITNFYCFIYTTRFFVNIKFLSYFSIILLSYDPIKKIVRSYEYKNIGFDRSPFVDAGFLVVYVHDKRVGVYNDYRIMI